MVGQNKSHAVMAQRIEPTDSLDDFPTPPWAVRALMKYVLKSKSEVHHSVLEPTCGRGYMAQTLKEYFTEVAASDIHDYGYSDVKDFLEDDFDPVDWIITNPPFKSAEKFIHKSLTIVNQGLAVLERTSFLETIGRYERLYSKIPPSIVAQYSERVPMLKGRLDQKASTATSYAWIIWLKKSTSDTKLVWIPPCRKELEQDSDYLESFIAR